jgi:hypothetical protein
MIELLTLVHGTHDVIVTVMSVSLAFAPLSPP